MVERLSDSYYYYTHAVLMTTMEMTYMTYKIGEFSKMIGMEPSKIRYYGKKGVYRKARHDNGYRMFELEDAYHMNYFRALCCKGYSIKEAIETLDGVTLEQAIMDLTKNEKEIHKEILLLQQREKNIKETVALLKDVKENPFTVWVQKYPTYIVQPASKHGNYEYSQINYKERYRWQERHPFLRYLGFGRTECFLQNEEQYIDNGQGVKEEDFITLQFPNDPTLLRFELQECLCFYAHLDERESVNIREYPHVQKYIETNYLRLKEEYLYFYFMIPIPGLGKDAGVMCIPIE